MTDRSLDLDVGPEDGGSFGLPSSPRAPLEITAVVPVYRSAPILPELYRRLTDALVALADRHEIILVEDFGGDDSWSVIEGLARRDDCVRGIRMSRNYGQHNALLAGIRAARYPIIVTLDDDLQNPPEEIHKLIEALDDGTDVVYGTPESEQHGFLRDQSSRITKLALQGAMGAETARNVERVPRLPHPPPRRVRDLPRPVRLDRRAPDLGDDEVLAPHGPARAARRWAPPTTRSASW